MLRELASFKPFCSAWGTVQGCRKGAKCKFRHSDSRSVETIGETPSLSRFIDDDGRIKVSPRPPLTEALKAFFRERNVDPMSLGVPGRTWSIDDEHRTSVITYPVMPGSFRPVNEQEVQAVLAQRGSMLTTASGTKSFRGVASATLPQFLAHATSVAGGVQICCDGKFTPEPSGSWCRRHLFHRILLCTSAEACV